MSLQLFQNNLSGQVPAELGDFKKLVNLSLYSNSLTGPLPQKLGSWAQFNYIDVTDNLLNGTIPPDMCKQGTMMELLMLDNNFTGEIPATYANCSTLIRFRVNHNLLSGTVPSGIWGLPNLKIIDITSNNIKGRITSDIKNAEALRTLFVGNNWLSGSLPKLNSLDLNSNQLSGRIPQSFSSFAGNLLDLSYNGLTGPIPQAVLDYGYIAGNAGLCLLDISSGVPSCENPYITPLADSAEERKETLGASRSSDTGHTVSGPDKATGYVRAGTEFGRKVSYGLQPAGRDTLHKVDLVGGVAPFPDREVTDKGAWHESLEHELDMVRMIGRETSKEKEVVDKEVE
ncbi:Receptor-like protein kinase HAIKU2 [Morella rubra]|uniref:Receptor-like protein kinase HAIKU2 n=1 Tax=Morella rubra TaxID=262757 RepID=A0A6A1WD72_9ROSI|nr:Receptor-like protein kinase HAIKU2 [Morella rubra]